MKNIALILAVVVILILLVAYVVGALYQEKPVEHPLSTTITGEDGTKSPASAGMKVSQPGPRPPKVVFTKGQAVELYENLQKRIAEYKTIQVRTRLEFPHIAIGGAIQAEVRFDAVRPDRYIHTVLNSKPVRRGDPETKYDLRPHYVEYLRDSDKHYFLSYKTRLLHFTDLGTKTDEESVLAVLKPMTKQAATRFQDPLQDLLYKIPFADQMREFQSAELVDKKQGKEVHILFRMTRRMNRGITETKTKSFLPVDGGTYDHIMNRKDIFDLETGLPKKRIFLDREGKDFLIQTYPLIRFDEEIPKDRFKPDLPEGVRYSNIIENLLKRAEIGLHAEDYRKLLLEEREGKEKRGEAEGDESTTE